MAKSTEAYKQCQALQADLQRKRTEISALEKAISEQESSLSEMQKTLAGAVKEEIKTQELRLSEASKLLKSGNVQEAYLLIANSAEEQQAESKEITKYDFMPRADTYALAVRALRKACEETSNPVHPRFTRDDGSKVYRPLTFQENIRAMVEDYETLTDEDGNKRTIEDRLKLFTESWKDSCTGNAYKAESTKFKIIPECEQLITIAEGFNNTFLQINYDEIGEGTELDSLKGEYNQQLPKPRVLENPGWRTSVPDEDLLTAYADIVYANPKREVAMAFWVRQNTTQDELRRLCVRNLNDYSDASGNYVDLDISGRFLLGSPTRFSIGNKG